MAKYDKKLTEHEMADYPVSGKQVFHLAQLAAGCFRVQAWKCRSAN